MIVWLNNPWKDISVSQYGYDGSIAIAVDEWNDPPYTSILNSTPSESSADIKYYIAEDYLPPGIGGITDFFLEISGQWLDVSSTVPSTGQPYHLARITIDHSNIKNLPYFGPDFRAHLLGHETGHALGLNHFYNDEFGTHSGVHWMTTCNSQNPCLTEPTQTDENHLITKYLDEYY